MTDGPQVLVGPAAGLDSGVAGARVVLAAEDLHHLRRVLRLADGSPLTLTDGAGRVASAVLAGDTAVLDGPSMAVARPAPRLALVQGLTRGRRADDGVRTACELGVDLLVPLVTDRTQGRPGAAERTALVARWRAVAAAALVQSRGAWAAEVADIMDVAALATAPVWHGPRLVAVPGGPPLPDVLAAAGPVAAAASEATVGVAVGPEGGWTADEVATLTGAGWRPVGLGPTVLRSEHAGPAALAVIAAATGRWAVGR